jgi:hypothetical protein
MSTHKPSDAPSWRYYDAVVGAWSGALEVVAPKPLTSTEPQPRVGILAWWARGMLLLRQRLFGPLIMRTRVTSYHGDEHPRVLHETWIAGKVLRYFRSREWIVPASDGRHAEMTLDAWWLGLPLPRRRGRVGHVVVSEDALTAEYEFPIAGVPVVQSARRDEPATVVVLEQRVRGVAFRVELRRR